MIVPGIKQQQTEAQIEARYQYALHNLKYEQSTFNPPLHRYRGLKISFGLALGWLFVGFPLIAILWPVIPIGHNRLLGIGFMCIILGNFIIEMFYGGGKRINASHTSNGGFFS